MESDPYALDNWAVCFNFAFLTRISFFLLIKCKTKSSFGKHLLFFALEDKQQRDHCDKNFENFLVLSEFVDKYLSAEVVWQVLGEITRNLGWPDLSPPFVLWEREIFNLEALHDLAHPF